LHLDVQPLKKPMQDENLDQRLSLIPTLWSLVYRAHGSGVETANAAREQLLERYGSAVRRYLRKVLRDPDATADVFQEFALSLVHGDLHGADPRRGRFRNFVKGTLFHLVADYCKQRRRWPWPLPDDRAALVAAPDNTESDRHFDESWRDELLARAWGALADLEATTGQPFYTVLRLRAEHPEIRSPQLAEELAARLGRPISPASVRQTLHRAREKFAALLLDEVTHSLNDPTVDQVQQELAELGLLEYCRPAVAERQGK
jgi:RNA polymerase sigma-70 factor (ECF subfamily)